MSLLDKLKGKGKNKPEETSEILEQKEEINQEVINQIETTIEEEIEEESQDETIVEEDNTIDQNLTEALELTEEEKAIASVVGVRLALDESIQLSEAIFGKKSRVYNRIFNSKAWLGKLLAELGSKNPYTTEKPVTIPNQIPPTADVSQGLAKMIYDYKLKNSVEQIVDMRDRLQHNTDAIESLDVSSDLIKDKRLAAIAKTQAYVNICEARFELGYELSVIRDRNK